MGKCPEEQLTHRKQGKRKSLSRPELALALCVWRIRGKMSRREDKLRRLDRCFATGRPCMDEFCSKYNGNPLTRFLLACCYVIKA